MTYLIILFGIFFLILSFKRLDLALMLIVAFLPAYQIRFSVFGLPATVLELMILISFAVWFLKYTKFVNFLTGEYSFKEYLKERRGRIGYPFGAEMIAFLIVSYIAIAVAGFTDSALGVWKAYFFEPALFYVMALNVFGSKTGFGKGAKGFVESFPNNIMLPLTASVFFIDAVAFFQKFTGAWIMNDFWAAEETRRVTSVFAYPNALGIYLGMTIPIIAGWGLFLLKRGKKYRCLSAFVFLTVILSCVSIVFAKSEGALLGVVSAGIFAGLLFNNKTRIAMAVVVLFAGSTIFFLPSLKSYVIEKATLSDLSGEIRKQQWRETGNMLKDGKIIWGSGLANYREAISSYHQDGIFYNFEKDPDFRRKIVIFDDKYRAEHWQPVEIYMYPHNVFLNFWVELGLLGMLAFVWTVGKIFYYCGQTLAIVKKKQSACIGYDYIILGVVGALTATLVHGIVDVPYFKNDLAVLFWLLIVVLSVARLNILYETKK